MKTCLVGLAILLAPYLTGPTLSAQTLHLGNTGEPQTLDPHRYNLRKRSGNDVLTKLAW